MTTTAHVRVVIEVPLGAGYEDGWQMGEIVKQAKREAVERVEQLMRAGGMKIRGQPRVILLISEEQLNLEERA